MKDRDDLVVHLVPDDATTSQAAGIRFARSLAGARTAAFLMALAEQEDLIRGAILQAGHSVEQAREAAGHFAEAAADEWDRLAGAHWPPGGVQ